MADAHLIPGVAPRSERRWQGRSKKRGTLLGFKARDPNLPCTVSVPNLITDRPHLLAGMIGGLNVRRLMYQSLIWSAVLGNQARGLGPPLDAQHLQGAADSLIDGMG